jgi:hypothetical protein
MPFKWRNKGMSRNISGFDRATHFSMPTLPRSTETEALGSVKIVSEVAEIIVATGG